MNIKANVTYKINPRFDEWSTDTYELSPYNRENDGGLFFYRMIDGERPADEMSWFNDVEINEGVLVPA